MKRLLFLLFFLLFPIYGYCASIVNVEYIHQAIKQKWNVDIPYSAQLENPKIAANMKYLLTMIDRANARLNGFETTTYGDNATYATLAAADTIATDAAVQGLIAEMEYPFSFASNSSSTTFSFQISAAGTFYVDWGDGTVERYEKNNTSLQTISHTYSDAVSNYKIRLGGQATRYNYYSGAISFMDGGCTLKSIEGSLGEIFPYGNNLNFYRAFESCKGLTDIPENLFAGIQGAPAQNMFSSTFARCSGLTSIPENLFAGIQGAPAYAMFMNTFSGCSGLTGSIPENLFAGIKGAPAHAMFMGTFYGCSGLTSIPENLFAGIQGAPAQSVFSDTFSNCSGLTSIPENLFAGIQGAPAIGMFSNTFKGCSGLTGSIPENLFAGIKGAPARTMFYMTFYGCSGLTGSIPEKLFAGIQGAPANIMFGSTFYGCSGLTSIPENLFAGIRGAPAGDMFGSTFYGCSSLTSIPENLFAGIQGAPAVRMFYRTFYDCKGLTGSIPENLFAGIQGAPAQNMFERTFFGCSGLTGPSARINGEYLYNIWPNNISNMASMYYGATGLSDYSEIPAGMK